ncbi:MAG: hypothetical protein LPK85_06400, partial [Gammaproteobacteria bacterium]|nr:hypothetical protein [Gammaproteobacteria bacterium]
VLCATGLLGYFFLVDAEPELFKQTVFYTLFVTLILLIANLSRQYLSSALPRRDLLTGLLLGLGSTTLIFLVVGPVLRILADETNLLSTSMGFFLHREIINITEVLHYYQDTHIQTAQIAHRPGLFAFLTSLVHFITGYQWFNGFVLNFCVGTASIMLFYVFFSACKDRLLGTLCAVMLAAFPVFQLNIASSGFDALNMLMVSAVYMQLFRFMEKPDGLQLEALLLLTLLAAQARYETAILLLPAGLAFLMRWSVIRQAHYTLALPLIPFLALPIIWQKKVSATFSNPGEQVDTTFALANLGDNALNMVGFFIDTQPRGLQTRVPIVLLAALGAVLLVIHLIQRRSQGQPLPLSFLGLCVLAQAGISGAHFAYYTGNYQFPWISRLAQVQLVWLVPLAAWGAYQLLIWLRVSKVWQGGLLMLLWLHGLSVAHANTPGKSLLLFREFKHVREYIQEHYDPANTLVINGRSGMFAALGYSAIDTGRAHNMVDALRINMERGLFQDILIIDTYNLDTNTPDTAYPENIQRQELARFQIDAGRSANIYRIERIVPK